MVVIDNEAKVDWICELVSQLIVTYIFSHVNDDVSVVLVDGFSREIKKLIIET